MVRRYVLATLILLVAATTGFARRAHAEVCQLKTPGFSVELMPTAYTILFDGKPLHRISGNDLLHEIFGGKRPHTDCAAIHSTPCFFAILVGWKRDLLLAFGPIRGGRGEISLNVMRWFPHDATFGAVRAASRDLEIIHGHQRDRLMHACWNQRADDRWHFGSGLRGGPCNADSPFGGASQTVIRTREVSSSTDTCETPVSMNLLRWSMPS